MSMVIQVHPGRTRAVHRDMTHPAVVETALPAQRFRVSDQLVLVTVAPLSAGPFLGFLDAVLLLSRVSTSIESWISKTLYHSDHPSFRQSSFQHLFLS